MPLRFKSIRPIAALAVLAFLGACTDIKLPRGEPVPDEDYYRGDKEGPRVTEGKITGEEGITFGGRKRRADEGGGGGIGVNAYLWRATLDTLSFMPLSSADPFGGVIITDWYAAPSVPNERFKMNVYILGRQLRADGIKVTVFRQIRNAAGWQDAPINGQLATDLENKVLSRARQLRMVEARR